ncbi:hypothetical protein DFH09DRAFT_1398709 [Mycena vulgaris]|nr:hypothetical protein DFH09DRAFT_1398709 [Mycena vulgaris]
MNQYISGGTGGDGGQGGQHGGGGGVGEGPRMYYNIQAEHFNVNTHGGGTAHQDFIKFIKEELGNHVATKYKYTDQSKTFCADNTRVEIQEEIRQWLLPQPSNSERILWITGIAGSGKSTLSATIADNLRRNHTPVAAQFFISRNIPETIDPNKIIPTIAKQLSKISPAAARVIHDTLKEDGFPSSREEQVKALLLAPIWELSKSCDVVIILIDALDELQNAAESVLEMLSPIAPRDCDLPDNVRFIITSRPEHWADISCSTTLEFTAFKQHTLKTESSVDEVHKFIVAKMQEITPRKPGWDGWPTDDQLLKLSEKANGLFHYAATALQWMKEQIRKRGTASRKQIFENLPKWNIDGPTQDADWRVNQLRGFQHVIGNIIVLYEPLTIHQITALLANISEDDFDVTNFLQQFRSVLIPGMTASFEEATPQIHKSFRDYIMNDHAPAGFRILSGHAHFVTARSCLEVIVKAGSQSDIDWKYSVGHWHRHLRKAVEEGVAFEDEGMWNLLGQIVEKAVVDIWGGEWINVFVDVAAAGWGLLKGETDKHRVEKISSILTKAKVVCAFPLSPVLVLLTLPRLLVSSMRCMLSLCHPCLSRSLSLTFWSLFVRAFSSVARACPAHSPSPSPLQFVCAVPPSAMLISLTLPCLWVSRMKCEVRVFPLLPVLVPLTLPRFLVSRGACFSSATPARPTHSPLSPGL